MQRKKKKINTDNFGRGDQGGPLHLAQRGHAIHHQDQALGDGRDQAAPQAGQRRGQRSQSGWANHRTAYRSTGRGCAAAMTDHPTSS